MKQIIAPSILAADQSNFKGEVDAVLAGGADWIHVDVMDGHFVPPISFGAGVVSGLRKHSSCFLDVHLMIENPERHLEEFAKAGASQISVHVEACDHLHHVLQRIRELGCKVGVALNPGTSLALIEPVLNQIDLLLIMTVNPGWGGQKYIPESTEKIRQAAAMLKAAGSQAKIEVDGGIDATTYAEAVKAGAEVLVAGTAIFASKDYAASIAALRKV